RGRSMATSVPVELLIPAMLSRATLFAGSAFAISTNEVIDIVLVLVDQPFDVLATRASLRTRIGDRTPQSHVVAHEIRACRILQLILHVSLLHLEVTVDVTTIMRFAAFRHLLMLRFVWSARARRMASLLAIAQTAGPSWSYRSTNKTRYRPPSQNPSGSVMRSRSAFTRPSPPTP